MSPRIVVVLARAAILQGMFVVVVTSVVGLAVVTLALLRDEPMVPRGVAGQRPQWRGAPEPADFARVTFPMSTRGYDPATVDVHMEAMLRAYEDLWTVAGDEVRRRAAMRAEARAGRVEAGSAITDSVADEIAATSVPEPPEAAQTDAEALQVHAALTELETRQHAAPNDGDEAPDQ